jgi:hypothetical protein
MAADNILQYLGQYVPSTEIWQVVQELSTANPGSDQFKELIVRLALLVNRINLSVNTKDTGIFDNANEFVTSSQYFPNPIFVTSTSSGEPDQTSTYRAVYRTVINFGQLPAAGIKSVPHNINCTAATSFVRIYGTATQPSTSYIPLPYSSVTAVADNIELYVDTTNVNVATAIDYSAYTTSYIVLEYLQI